ncbi:MAG: hypothetical protein WAT93_14100 [Pontixanthobacter sp.]
MEPNWLRLLIGLGAFALPAPSLGQSLDSGSVSALQKEIAQYEDGQIYPLAASFGEMLIEELEATGAERDLVIREKCRHARNLALASMLDDADDALAAIDAVPAPTGKLTRLGCASDRAIVMLRSARIDEAKLLASSVTAENGGLPQESLIQLRALTTLATILALQSLHEESVALHQRAAEEAETLGVKGKTIALQNRIALFDAALRTEEPETVLPDLYAMLDVAVEDYGETSIWVADFLERIAHVELSLDNLDRASRVFDLVLTIRSPDAVGIGPDENRAFLYSGIAAQRLDMFLGKPIDKGGGIDISA